MYQNSYILPKDNLVEDPTLPAGTYKVTVTGMSSATASVLVEGWNGSAWTTLATITKSASGIIGATAITVPASGRLRCSLTGGANPNSVKVRISK